MTRCALLMIPVAAACSSAPQPLHPATPIAPLSLAADQHMVMIPEGQYVAGSTPEERAAAYDDYQTTAGKDTARTGHWFDSEDDRHVEQASAFRIDLMPVTQAEFAEMVTATQMIGPTIDEAAWKQQGFAQDFATQVARYVWSEGRPPANHEDHPVVLVTWDEATRYCKWRGEQRGEPRRLPTAAEYEKATRGSGGLAYPWGNTYDADKLNSAVKGPGDTTPVGTYTAGASEQGVLDMAGNVFEWTSTPFAKGQITVKGSAWEDFAGVGRGASRHGRSPKIRHAIIGFRCAADVQ
jgi:formylglycine-generating enzyme required for sulfatase activity